MSWQSKKLSEEPSLFVASEGDRGEAGRFTQVDLLVQTLVHGIQYKTHVHVLWKHMTRIVHRNTKVNVQTHTAASTRTQARHTKMHS